MRILARKHNFYISNVNSRIFALLRLCTIASMHSPIFALLRICASTFIHFHIVALSHLCTFAFMLSQVFALAFYTIPHSCNPTSLRSRVFTLPHICACASKYLSKHFYALPFIYAPVLCLQQSRIFELSATFCLQILVLPF